MAKTNINFNNTNYPVDESSLSAATSALRQHLSTVMNGTGATINLGGTSYNIDAAKLTAAKNDFVSHLGTISGSGRHVVVGGVEYGVDSTKVAGAVSELETVLGELSNGGGESADTSIIFDGNVDGKDYFELTSSKDNSTFVKISNNTYSVEELSTFTYTVKTYCESDGGEVEQVFVCDGEAGMAIQVNPSIIVAGSDRFYFIVALESGEIYAEELHDKPIYVPSTGVYVWAKYDSYQFNSSDCTTLYAEIKLWLEPAEEVITYYTQEDIDNSGGLLMACGGTDPLYVVAAVSEDLSTITITKNGDDSDGAIASLPNGYVAGLGLPLTTIIIENGITFIGEYIASSCISLTSVTIPNSVTIIQQGAFLYCASLTDITIPSGVTYIGNYVFQDCHNLSTITIPNSTTFIGTAAFSHCTNLTDITFNGTVAQWNAIELGTNWNYNVPATYVQCSDGQVAL